MSDAGFAPAPAGDGQFEHPRQRLLGQVVPQGLVFVLLLLDLAPGGVIGADQQVGVVSNSAGMLTLVGDPATFLVGSAIGLSFGGYLRTASLGGLSAVLVMLPLLPRLMPEVWGTQVALPPAGPAPQIKRRAFVAFSLAALAIMVLPLAAGFTDWPTATLPVFIAMMFGATLGGNATLIGASANIVAVGICATQGERVSFMRFVRYGLPITLVQLTLGALYVLALTAFSIQ